MPGELRYATAFLLLFDPGQRTAHVYRVAEVLTTLRPLGKSRPLVRFNDRPPDEDAQANAVLSAAMALQDVIERELPDRRRLFGATVKVSAAPDAFDGRSSELLYALCLFARAVGWEFRDASEATGRMADRVAPKGGLVFAATGAVDQDGNIEAIAGVVQKVDEALKVLPPGARVLFPAGNHGDIGQTSLTLRAAGLGIDLVPVQTLDQALAELLPDDYQGWWSEPPYVGLRPFEVADSRIFFGRRDDVAALTERLLQRERVGRPGALIIADSGAGKSSFARAGVLASLRRGVAGRVLQYAIWRPRDVPGGGASGLTQAEVARGLFEAMLGPVPRQPNHGFLGLDPGAAIGGFDDLLRQLGSAVEARDDACRPLRVLLIDQLEELFGLSAYQYQGDTRNQIGARIAVALASFLRALQRLGVWVLATLRRDTYNPLESLKDERGEAVLLRVFQRHEGVEGEFSLGPVDRAALLDLIVGPAALAQVTFEERGSDRAQLATLIVHDLVRLTDGLPLLSFTLQRLYEKCRQCESTLQPGACELTFDAYRSIQGVEHSLSQAAQSCFERFEEEVGELSAQTILANLLDGLSRVVDGRQRGEEDGSTYLAVTATRASLVVGEPAAGRLIDALIANGVLEAGSDGIRVAHEVLFSKWPTAAAALHASRTWRLIAERFAERQAAFPNDLLSAPSEVEQARQLMVEAPHVLSRQPELKRFLSASVQRYDDDRAAERQRERDERRKEAAARRRDRRLIGGLIAAVLIVSGLLFFVFHYSRQADADSRAANARRLVLQAQAARLGFERTPLEQSMADVLFAGALADADANVQAEALAQVNEHPTLQHVMSVSTGEAGDLGDSDLWYLAQGRYVAASFGGAVTVFDARSGQRWWSVSVSAEKTGGTVDPSAAGPSTVESQTAPSRMAGPRMAGALGAVSKSGELFAHPGEAGVIQLDDLVHRGSRRLMLDGMRPAALAFSRDERWLGALAEDGSTRFWDLAAAAPPSGAMPSQRYRPMMAVASPADDDPRELALRLSEQGSHVAVRIGDRFQVFRRTDGVRIDGREPPLAYAGRQGLLFSFVDDGDQLVYLLSARARIDLRHDGASPAGCDASRWAARGPDGLDAVSADDSAVELVRGPGCRLSVFDHERGEVVARIDVESAGGPIALTDDGDLAVYGTVDGQVHLWRWRASGGDEGVGKPGETQPFVSSAYSDGLLALAVQPGGRQLAALAADGSLLLNGVPEHAATGGAESRLRRPPALSAAARRCLRGMPAASDDRLLWVAGSLYVVGPPEQARLWDLATCTHDHDMAETWHVPRSSDDRHLAVPLSDGSVRVVSAETGATVLSLAINEQQMERLVFAANADASVVLLSPDALRLRLWRLGEPKQREWQASKAGKLVRAAVSPQGRFVATVHGDSIGLYSIERDEKPLTLFRHWQRVARIAGIAVDDEGRIRLSLNTGDEIVYPPPGNWRAVSCGRLAEEPGEVQWRARVSDRIPFVPPCGRRGTTTNG